MTIDYVIRKLQNAIDCLIEMQVENYFSEEEKVILKNLDKDYKWIARDFDGDLYVFEEKPIRMKDYWNSVRGEILQLQFDKIFQNVNWEDEPCEFRKHLEDDA